MSDLVPVRARGDVGAGPAASRRPAAPLVAAPAASASTWRPPPDRHVAAPLSRAVAELRNEGRHRRAAERRQVLALQRADEGGGGGRELPVHDGRAECRDRPGARRASSPSGRDLGAHRSSPRRSPSTTSPGSFAARIRARASATSSWRTSARRTRSCTSSAHMTIPRSSILRGGSIRARTRTRSRPSFCTPTSSRPSADSSASRSRRSRSTRRSSPRRRGCASWSPGSRREGRRATSRPPRTLPTRCGACTR